jgi:hypothetical protein
MPKEIWILMLAKGTECRLLLPNLFNEIVDGVEVSQDIYWLMALTFKFLFGLFEQLNQLYIRVVTIRLSNRECHREFRRIGIIASGRPSLTLPTGLEMATQDFDEQRIDLH